MKIILGSASARRQQILKEMGYQFDIVPADIDEKAIRDADPNKLTLALANTKADAIIPRLKDGSLLITSDLVVVFRDQILEKPVTKEEALEVLAGYKDEPVQTVCAVVVTNLISKKRVSGVDIATIYFKPLVGDDIRRFVESGKVFEHAGSFAAENPIFTPYVEKIEGTMDSIAGLPIELTQRLIQEASV